MRPSSAPAGLNRVVKAVTAIGSSLGPALAEALDPRSDHEMAKDTFHTLSRELSRTALEGLATKLLLTIRDDRCLKGEDTADHQCEPAAEPGPGFHMQESRHSSKQVLVGTLHGKTRPVFNRLYGDAAAMSARRQEKVMAAAAAVAKRCPFQPQNLVSKNRYPHLRSKSSSCSRLAESTSNEKSTAITSSFQKQPKGLAAARRSQSSPAARKEQVGGVVADAFQGLDIPPIVDRSDSEVVDLSDPQSPISNRRNLVSCWSSRSNLSVDSGISPPQSAKSTGRNAYRSMPISTGGLSACSASSVGPPFSRREVWSVRVGSPRRLIFSPPPRKHERQHPKEKPSTTVKPVSSMSEKMLANGGPSEKVAKACADRAPPETTTRVLRLETSREGTSIFAKCFFDISEPSHPEKPPKIDPITIKQRYELMQARMANRAFKKWRYDSY